LVIGDLLPLAVGIAISPIPIIAVILMLFSPKAKSNGLAFLLGWALALCLVGGLALLLADTQGLSEDGGQPSVLGALINLALGLLLLWLAVQQWRSRLQPGEQSADAQSPAMPAWMASIDTFTPVKALGMAALLSGVNPKNLALNLAAMATIAQSGLTGREMFAALLVFVLLSSLSVSTPVVYYLLGGEGGQKTLDGWKNWLATHNNAVMAVLLLVLGAKLVGNGVGGLIARGLS
jgi:hypothetical protein